MVRFIIFAAVLGLAFTIFAIIDAAMTEPTRARGVNKPTWVLLCVILPVIGGLLWLTVGKAKSGQTQRTVAPDDDEAFNRFSTKQVDERIADLEAQLRALDDEVFPGEAKPGDQTTDGSGDGLAGGSTTKDTPDGTKD